MLVHVDQKKNINIINKNKAEVAKEKGGGGLENGKTRLQG